MPPQVFPGERLKADSKVRGCQPAFWLVPIREIAIAGSTSSSVGLSPRAGLEFDCLHIDRVGLDGDFCIVPVGSLQFFCFSGHRIRRAFDSRVRPASRGVECQSSYQGLSGAIVGPAVTC